MDRLAVFFAWCLIGSLSCLTIPAAYALLSHPEDLSFDCRMGAFHKERVETYPEELPSMAESLRARIVEYGKSLKGIKYKYAASSPGQGFDCSGFIYHVFTSLNINVPRSSAGLAGAGKAVTIDEALPGDIIIFTGTAPGSRSVGHSGIVSSMPGEAFTFLHSTSGREYGVTETPLSEAYRRRFVKVVRLIQP